jgi:hypothetical protein
MRMPTMKSGPVAARTASKHHVGEAHAVVERAVVIIGALVGGGRPEAVHQMAVRLEFDAIEAGGLHPLGGEA